MNKSKVTVITHGRFHHFDLAEQLQAVGRLAAIYTGNPRFTLRDTRVAPRLVQTWPFLHVAHLAAMRVPGVPRSVIDGLGWQAAKSLRAYAARTLPDCGVVVAGSGAGLAAAEVVHDRGGIFMCDRAGTHIRWVERLLADEFDMLDLPWSPYDPKMVATEEEEYASADVIGVGSSFAKRSFLEMGFKAEKLRVTPYGVNLSAFRPCAERASNFRILHAGQFSVRKGVHYLLQAFRRAGFPGAELIAIGGPVPESEFLLKRYSSEGFTWKGIVPREEVPREMSRASVLVLASIEDGFGLVMAQALACGCPVIATTNTGAADLFTDGREGFIIPARDIDALVDRLTRLYRDKDLHASMSAAAIERVKGLGGWDQYGRNMISIFDEFLAKKVGIR